MLEKQVEKAVKEFARSRGILVRKFSSPNQAHVPDDLFFCLGGHLFLIEFKRPGGKPTAGQLREITRLRNLGFRVYVCDDIEQGKRIVLTEAGITAHPVSEESDQVFAAPRSGDAVAGHGLREDDC